MRRRPLIILALATALSLVGVSCLSPTLPLPPPETDAITDAMNGEWTISGTCDKGAIVLVFNETQGQGVMFEDRDKLGLFVVRLKADPCDVGWTSEILGVDQSPQASFVVEPMSPNDPGTPSICK